MHAVAACRDGEGVPFAGEDGRRWSDRRVSKIQEVKDWERHEAVRKALRAGALSGAHLRARVRAGMTRIYSAARLGVDVALWPSAMQARIVGVVAMALAFGRRAIAVNYRELAALMGCSEGTARNAVRSAIRLGYIRRRAMFEREENSPRLWQTANVYEPGPELMARWATFQLMRAIWKARRASAKAERSRRAAAAARCRWANVNSRQKQDFASTKQNSEFARARERGGVWITWLTSPATTPAPSGLSQLDLERLRADERVRQWYERASWDPNLRAWTPGRQANKGGEGRRPTANPTGNAPSLPRCDVSGRGDTGAPRPNSAQGEAVAAHVLGQLLAVLGAVPPANVTDLRRSVRRARWRLDWRRRFGRDELPEI